MGLVGVYIKLGTSMSVSVRKNTIISRFAAGEGDWRSGSMETNLCWPGDELATAVSWSYPLLSTV